MTQSPRKGPEYSRERKFKVILEDLQAQFRTFGEGLDDVRQRLERVEDHVSHIPSMESDLALLKSAFRPFTLQVSEHEHRINHVEKRLNTLESSRP